MKRLLLLLTLCLTVSAAFSQGASCGAPIEVPLDGSMANHASSSTLGLPLVCTNFSATNTPITWFSFKTNAAANCPLLIIKANDGQPCEVAFYTSCNGGQALQTPSSMCFDDGQGLWAPAETFVLSANTVYYLRVRTSTACTISIGGQSHVPDNNTCLGATSLSTVEVSDNNACHKPGTGITPDQVCAFSIENTAFYQFYIATTGSAVININNISCDNGAGNNNSGFQIGFFKGSCNALVPINCTSGSGSFVQATTDPLPAGTHVYVAIDGMTGSNCKYTIAGLNIYGVLSSQQLQHFSVWKKPAQNVVSWKAHSDSLTKFDIERSADGQQFVRIGMLTSYTAGVTTFQFNDHTPIRKAYYRIRRTFKNGTVSLSKIIYIERESVPGENSLLLLQKSGQLTIQAENDRPEWLHYTIASISGSVVAQGKFYGVKGTNRFTTTQPSFIPGSYILTLTGATSSRSQKFIMQ